LFTGIDQSFDGIASLSWLLNTSRELLIPEK